MSFVPIFVGQCGNQIASQFWNVLNSNEESLRGDIFLRGKSKLRSILVDSEPKVVRKCVQDAHQLGLRVDDWNIIHGNTGRGCNWALGYHGLKMDSEKNIVRDVLDSARRESERCDIFNGFLIHHSLCGGTGSGLTSRLLDELREIYDKEYIISCCVAPDIRGESPMQYLNSLLCLNTLQKTTNCCVLFRNDKLLEIVGTKNGNQIENMNFHIASCLGDMYIPNESVSYRGVKYYGSEPSELLDVVAPDPSYKFLSANTANSDVSWGDLAVRLARTLVKKDDNKKLHAAINLLPIAKGYDSKEFSKNANSIFTKLNSLFNRKRLENKYWIGKKSDRSKSLTVISNHTGIVDLLEIVEERSRTMLEAKAYLHWYEKYERDIELRFKESIENIALVRDNYNSYR
ncbi:DgyrCDS12223 [Dimorphilus gyrociliatus]|uniref:DgyrCDS12223 n=1 Tax=Dimorphilus gyrociliatus TaxID=2664684 RepID=A0A7I8W6U8_9ANNE|nr:DgyrCDS12223 [Dimorphilus gyrociliatus]